MESVDNYRSLRQVNKLVFTAEVETALFRGDKVLCKKKAR